MSPKRSPRGKVPYCDGNVSTNTCNVCGDDFNVSFFCVVHVHDDFEKSHHDYEISDVSKSESTAAGTASEWTP